MLENDQYHRDYVAFVDNFLACNYAYNIQPSEIFTSPERIWYLPNHGIYHPRKPQKIRIVFDCSATFNGSSLNDRLLQGPSLTNSLIGVLTRFRAEPVAFMADIEAMFHQVKVPLEQHDQLRFLWWPDDDLQFELEEYRMAVHIFGAVSSPSIANFALKATADKAEEKYGTEAADTIRKNFYVDDWLKSAANVRKVIQLIKDVQSACAEGGFRLTKFVSNSRDVLKSNPSEDRAKQIQTYASSIGYGCVAYLRLLDEGKNINVSFLMGKSRLAPVRTVTIPRLELTAVSVSLQLGQQLLNQLDMEIDEVSYYTDSTTVLHYINNEAKRFPVFVANRVRLIRDYSQPSQWKFIDFRTKLADIASRGMSIGQFLHADTWLHGPKFLHAHESEWPDCSIPSTPAETVQTTDLQPEMNHCMEKLISHYSNWYRLKRALAVYIFLRDVLHSRIKQKHKLKKYHNSTDQPFTVGRLEEAELVIIKYVQHVAFPSECESLSDVSGKRSRVLKSSSIYKLDPFMEGSVLRLGGRLSRPDIQADMMHQILLAHKNHVTKLIIQDIHVRLGHGGRNHVLSILREKYWVIKANSTVRNILSHCVTCRRMRTPVCNQKMADLPASRVNPSPPFTHTALRRFTVRRGPVKQKLCDNGTNFVRAEKELREAVMEMDQDRVKEYLLKQHIEWTFTPPAASHMGGSWERMIGSVRKVLAPLLKAFCERLDDESYRTLLCEVE
ncbi:uncharacterized protein LOC124259655 [Haliotis rubra]|uniref:uncharacterized protein LOC124259655 n=1 Tax=Haliotis rubra TaxID=36100 RepID=UPI001EE5138B|nr:uncharacterized protein LOC124259655 [Haliotis rubra]